MQCLLPFDLKPFIFKLAIQKYRHQDTQNHNFVSCFIRVQNLVCHINRRTQTVSVWKWGPDVYNGVLRYLFATNNYYVWKTVKNHAHMNTDK